MKKEFVEKILRVQEQLKAPKSNYNSFGKYRYRSLEDILTAAKPLLAAEGLMLTIKDDVEQIGDRYYIKAVAEITDGEDTIQNTALAREEDVKKGMDGSQITGTASSYARKYCLNGLLLIDDTKDADTDEFRAQSQRSAAPYPHSGEKKRQTPKKMTAKAVDTLVQILMDEKIPLDKFMKQYGISELKELPFEVYEKVYKDHTQKAVQDA
jgi:hypothetical protein